MKIEESKGVFNRNRGKEQGFAIYKVAFAFTFGRRSTFKIMLIIMISFLTIYRRLKIQISNNLPCSADFCTRFVLHSFMSSHMRRSSAVTIENRNQVTAAVTILATAYIKSQGYGQLSSRTHDFMHLIEKCKR